MSLLMKLIKQEKITNEELSDELYDICERVHSSCDSDCPVYELNGNKAPNSESYGEITGCDTFKSGRKMLYFIRSKIWINK